MQIQKKTCTIILNYNSSGDSIEIFQLLQSFQLSNLFLLVLDNVSEPEDIANLRKNISDKNLILNNENLGYAGGNNVGIEYAINQGFDYVWILNPDIRVEKRTLPLLLKTIEKKKKVAAVGPRILRRENEQIIFSDGGEIEFDYKCSVKHKHYLRSARTTSAGVDFDVDYVDGSCILISLKAVEALGLLPEEYFLYFEEADWCVNAKRNGWQLAVNSHSRAFNLRSKREGVYFYYLIRNKMIFARKYHPHPEFVQFYLFCLLIKEFWFHVFGLKKYWFWKARMKGFLDTMSH